MSDLIKELGLVELPVLDLLDASIRQQKFTLSDQVRESIVVTFGRALVAAIELANENKNA